MNSRNPVPCAMHRSKGLAAAFSAVASARVSRGIMVCSALFSTSCGGDSDAQASNSSTAGSTTTSGSQTTAAGTVGSTSGATLTGSTTSSMTSGATATTDSTGGTATSTTGGTSTGADMGGTTGADMGGTTGAGGASTGSSNGGAGGGVTGSGGATTGGVSEDATIVPDPGWACGMADGIPSPTQGELAFTITLDISGEHEVGNTPYGYRRLLEVSGGTITGDRLQGTVLTGGLEYELTLSNGVMEHQGINILDTGDGSRIFVRSCGVAPDEGSTSRIIPDFEATTSGEYAFLNTGTWVATREVKDGKMTLDVYDVSNVTVGEPRVEITKPDGVPPQPWECNMTTGSQGAEVFTENVTLGGSFSIPNAKYGSRNVIPITGGTVSGRVTGSILNGGADYQLSGALDAWYTLAPDNGELILVRNCGAGGLIPWFEAAVDGDFDFLNTQAYLSSAPGVGAGGVTITFYERN
ncbi:MAG TPA: DUF3237 family protein [Polyangiaceae bacterium]|nr:DUF3237 family protein [Polyangiaceae bacterium]